MALGHQLGPGACSAGGHRGHGLAPAPGWPWKLGPTGGEKASVDLQAEPEGSLSVRDLGGGGGVTVPALPSAQGRGARVCTTWERVPHAAHGPPQCLRYVGGLHQGQRSASLTQAQVQGWHPGQGTEPGAAAFQSGRQAAGSTCAENTHTWGRQCGRRWAVTLRAQLPTQREGVGTFRQRRSQSLNTETTRPLGEESSGTRRAEQSRGGSWNHRPEQHEETRNP